MSANVFALSHIWYRGRYVSKSGTMKQFKRLMVGRGGGTGKNGHNSKEHDPSRPFPGATSHMHLSHAIIKHNPYFHFEGMKEMLCNI